MKILAELTDLNMLGLPGTSTARPRITARAVLVRSDGCIAVMNIAKYGMYMLPGGGVDPGESIEDALRREIAEETGCTCSDLIPLGLVTENRAHADYTQHSHYYLVHTASAGAPHYTPDEIANGTTLQWHAFADAWRLIAAPVHEVPQRRFLQARDMAALTEYQKTEKP